jgi:hypothetical protein
VIPYLRFEVHKVSISLWGSSRLSPGLYGDLLNCLIKDLGQFPRERGAEEQS